MPDSPLATYRERLLQVRRVIELYSDRVVVRARWISGKRYEMTIRLETLDPRPKEMWIRQRVFKQALAVAMLAAAGAIVFNRTGAGVGEQTARLITYGLFVIALIAGAIAAMGWPKVRFIRFARRDGPAGLDVARAGPDAGRFDDFVNQLRTAIRRR